MIEKIENIFSTKKKLATGMLLAALILAIPFTFSQFSQQQDIRQRASEAEKQMGPAASITGSTDAVIPQAAGDCAAAHPGLDAEEKAMINLHNEYRQSKGLPTLAVSQKLNIVAANLAEDEAIHGYSAHVDSKGRNIDQRFPDCGLTFTAGAENAGSAASTQAMFDAWLASPGHKDNIEKTSVVAMGVARANWNGKWIWITDFMAPNPGGSPTDDNSTNTGGGATATPIQTQPTATKTPTPTGQTGATNTPIPTISNGTTATPIMSGNTLSISISLPGIGSSSNLGQNPNPNPSTKSGTVELFTPNTNTSVQKIPATFTYSSGNSTFTTTVNVPTGTYDVKVKTDNSLVKDLGIIQLNAGQNQANPAQLITGDLNQDNVLSLLDYNIFISCFGTKQCSQKSIADVNMDSKVNEIDLNIFYSGLASRSGD